MDRRQRFLRFMRYLSVAVVTVLLLAFVDVVFQQDAPAISPGLFILMCAVVFFYVTIPIVGFWLYSFIIAIRRRTKTDRILLWLHIADLLILVIGVYLANLPPLRCDAFIMAQQCKGETGFWMRNIVGRYRNMLPDSTHLCVEFNNDRLPQCDILSERDMKKLKEELEDFCGCIGMEIDSYSDSDYSTILFRRINMGMYAFRFYDHPLTPQQCDSLNADECLIVYNDSTVFEFRAGVLGAQSFPGKQEFIETLCQSNVAYPYNRIRKN